MYVGIVGLYCIFGISMGLITPNNVHLMDGNIQSRWCDNLKISLFYVF